MYCSFDKHIRLEYCVHDNQLHIAEITDPRYKSSPALINKIQETVAFDFIPYAYRMMAKYNYELPFTTMKVLFTQWMAKYMARKKKWPVISEYYKLLYNERERSFAIRDQKEGNINDSWSLIANRVHLDTIMEFIENARYVFYDHKDYYPDGAAVRYALQMWIAHHAEGNTTL